MISSLTLPDAHVVPRRRGSPIAVEHQWRPHEYLLRRRIEHAQHPLVQSRHKVLDVALSCGFRSQAHFTTVFKRLVGETPYCWRMKANVDR